MREGLPNRLRIGVAYNIKGTGSQTDQHNDAEAEFDSPATVEAIRNAIRALGHDIVDLEANHELPGKISAVEVDFVFNIAEGLKGRNREAQVPALLELMDIPYTGSDSTAMTITLDKGLTKKIVAEAGVATPSSFLVKEPGQKIPLNLSYPLIVKPVAEGSSKGITQSSVVNSEAALRAAVDQMVGQYHQPALVETYVGGREFTVGVFEDRDLEVLPPMEIIFLHKEESPIYSYQYKLEWEKYLRYDTNPQLTKLERKQIDDYARKAFVALGCRDVARMDFRMDLDGKIYFLECNALPGLAPDWSDLCFIASAAGLSYAQLIQKIITPGLRRLTAARAEYHESTLTKVI